MSDNDNTPPAPSKQTSSVPLKKETVRVTLKAADAPPAVPSAAPPTAPVVKPPVPTAPPAPSIAGGAPKPPAPAPTIPLRTAGAPTAKAPAPTIRLATSPAPAAKPGGPAPLPAAGAAAPGMALPKATVQLQPPTQPLGSSFSSTAPATLAADDEDEETDNEGLANILSIVGFVAALVVLIFQIMTASIWINAADSPRSGEWSQLMN